jgi:hypothetical protein
VNVDSSPREPGVDEAYIDVKLTGFVVSEVLIAAIIEIFYWSVAQDGNLSINTESVLNSPEYIKYRTLTSGLTQVCSCSS